MGLTQQCHGSEEGQPKLHGDELFKYLGVRSFAKATFHQVGENEVGAVLKGFAIMQKTRYFRLWCRSTQYCPM